jgi:hypothetical protein
MLDIEGAYPHRRANGSTDSEWLAGADVHETQAISYQSEDARFESDTRRIMNGNAKLVFASGVLRHKAHRDAELMGAVRVRLTTGCH